MSRALVPIGISPVSGREYAVCPDGEVLARDTPNASWRFESTAAGWRTGVRVFFPDAQEG